MANVFMTDPITGRAALYIEAPGDGDPDDPNSARNRPLNSPFDWLDNIYFHSDFDYYSVAAGPMNITVNHPSLAAGTPILIDDQFNIYAVGNQGQTAATFYTHGLGYRPYFMVIYNGVVLTPCTIVQQDGTTAISIRTRTLTFWATTSGIAYTETMFTGDTALAAISRTYTLLVFKQPTIQNTYMLDYDPPTGRVMMGLGKFDSGPLMLRRSGISGDTPYDFAVGPTVDISNGSRKEVLPDGTVHVEPGYNGSFTGGATFQGAIA